MATDSFKGGYKLKKNKRNGNLISYAFKDFWLGFLKPKGRLDLKTFGMETLLYVIMLFGVSFILGLISPSLSKIASIYGFILFIPMAMAGIRRMQDSGRSLTYSIIISLIFAGICILGVVTKDNTLTIIADIILIYNVCKPSQENNKKKE